MIASLDGVLHRAFVLPLALLAAASLASTAQAATVAVVDFDNATGDRTQDGVGKIVADAIASDLAQLGSFQVVPRARTEQLPVELKPALLRRLHASMARRIGEAVSADIVVGGSLL